MPRHAAISLHCSRHLSIFTAAPQARSLLPSTTSKHFGRRPEKFSVSRSLACSVVGSSETVERGLHEFIEKHQPDELMVTAHLYDQQARLRSFELIAEVRNRMGARVA